jgi:hypothetical protein
MFRYNPPSCLNYAIYVQTVNEKLKATQQFTAKADAVSFMLIRRERTFNSFLYDSFAAFTEPNLEARAITKAQLDAADNLSHLSSIHLPRFRSRLQL